MTYIAKERLSLDKDDKVVPAGDRRAVRLLVHKGGKLSDSVAAKYGLVNDTLSTSADKPPAVAPPAFKGGLKIDNTAREAGSKVGVGKALKLDEAPKTAEPNAPPPEDVSAVLPKAS